MVNSENSTRNQSNLETRRKKLRLPEDFPCVRYPGVMFQGASMSRAHVHAGMELGICHQGAGVFVVGERRTPFTAGDVSVIDAEVPHVAIAAPGAAAHCEWIMLDPAGIVLPELTEGLRPWPEVVRRAGDIFTSERSPRVVSLVSAIGEEMQQTADHHHVVIRSLLPALLVELERIADDTPDAASESDQDATLRLAPVTQMISDRIHEPIGIEQLAEVSGLSPAQMRRLFQAAFGLSPQEYITRLRLELARVSLRDRQRTITEVSGDVGYEATSTFNRHFRRIYGVSPRQYRQALNQPT